ncbi:type II toxin-antitoxin system VapC family toxin [Benzoatithermus flavus]|uniref:Ribonuclease VapC n=1 Tax=Benzoatithermus flavus TaxID=3108223 RepID=A0ABU8XP09_9PROT
MIVDTSALVAILLDEPETVPFARLIAAASPCIMSAASYVEFGVLAASRAGYDALAVDAALRRWKLEIAPVTAAQARLALDAFHRCGKGRHPAGLNFGDRFAYALAKERGEPLLFKGGDFAQTDIASAR